MGRFIVIQRGGFLKTFAAVCFGVLLGAVVSTILMGHQIDQLIIEKENLHTELGATQKELKQIKENQEKRKAPAVTSIEARISFPKDSFSKYEGSSLQIELEKKIVEMLHPINGREIETLDVELIPQIIDGRNIIVENRTFELKVQTVIISQNLKLSVMAKPTRTANEQGAF